MNFMNLVCRNLVHCEQTNILLIFFRSLSRFLCVSERCVLYTSVKYIGKIAYLSCFQSNKNRCDENRHTQNLNLTEPISNQANQSHSWSLFCASIQNSRIQKCQPNEERMIVNFESNSERQIDTVAQKWKEEKKQARERIK